MSSVKFIDFSQNPFLEPRERYVNFSDLLNFMEVVASEIEKKYGDLTDDVAVAALRAFASELALMSAKVEMTY